MTKYISTAVIAILISCGAMAQGVSFTDNTALISSLQQEIASLDEDHCEVPCGIYGDSLRISLIKEHVSTIEKAMTQINEISKAEKPNYNQLVRWINNKEKHAEEIQHIVAQYFLHQRVKMPKADLGKKALKKANQKYFGLLSSLHAMQVYAMKCKQTTDLNQVGNLNSAIDALEGWYFHGHKH